MGIGVCQTLGRFSHVALPILVVFILCGSAHGQQSPNLLTFVQITDVHLFDDGDDVGTDNRDAFDWSTKMISRLHDSGVNIDFVAFTGDIGLWHVASPEVNRCDHDAALAGGDPNKTRPYCFGNAIEETARHFKKFDSVSTRIVVVPGNNDLQDERSDSLSRYYEFMKAVRGQMHDSVLELLEPGRPIDIRGVKIVGVHSESFKRADNYAGACLRDSNPDVCPKAQFAALRKLVDGGYPILVFTHFPYVRDPFRCIGWQIDSASRTLWESAASQHNVMGIFAGHFHTANQTMYGNNLNSAQFALPTGIEIAQKTWIAPPLAVKNQAAYRPQARGFLLVMLNLGTGEIRVEPYWFVTEKTVPPNSKKSAPQCVLNEQEIGLD